MSFVKLHHTPRKLLAAKVRWLRNTRQKTFGLPPRRFLAAKVRWLRIAGQKTSGLLPRNFLGLFVFAAFLLGALASAAAADSARYKVTFNATWSVATHPTDFPSSPHFSSLIGGTHDAIATFWQIGGLATLGIERMAELGDPSALQSEVEDEIAQGSAVGVISGGEIGLSPGSVFTVFDITSSHPLVTLVSMIAPSPDWFVGVQGLSLRSGGSWIQTLTVNLDPYDAGTDSAVSFEDPEDDTNPQDPIAVITGFPFTGTPPLGTFTFELQRVLAACEDLVDNDLDGFVDHPADLGCDSEADTSEHSPSLECDDGIDNDADMLTDFPEDPGCVSLADPSEGSANVPALAPTGLGALIVLVFFATRFAAVRL